MKKTALLFYAGCFFFFARVPLFSLPGVIDHLPTFSGEYVYYRDYTFVHDTWIGFLQYDEYTYAIRYYSPGAPQGLPQILLYVTLNSEKNGVELSGEKIASPVSAADTDTVNYLHDIFYALSAQRKEANGSDFSKTVHKNADMYQFGGAVTLRYENYIPLFNLESITGEDKKAAFQAITFGRLVDSEDTSFSNFKPNTVEPIPFSSRVVIADDAQKTTLAAAGQKLTADSQWLALSENTWAQGDTAILILDTIVIDTKTFTDKPFTFFDYAVRTFSFSSPDSYLRLAARKEVRSEKNLRLENVFYAPSTQTAMRDIKFLQEVSPGSYSAVFVTVYDSVYQQYKAYYENILSSIKAD